MESAYRQTRRRLRRDFERLASFGTWEYFLDTGEVGWSPGIRDVLDTHDEPASREAFVSLLHPEDLDRFESSIRRLKQEGEPFDIDLRIIRSDGETRHLRALGHRVAEEPDERPRLVGALQDVTDQRNLKADRARLLGTILDVADEERQRLAVRVHDEVIPNLAVALRRAETMAAELGRDQSHALRAPILDAATSLREILADLVPPEITTSGFGTSLQDYLERIIDGDTAVETAIGELSGASDATLVTALRIAREAISNAQRHADASHLSITIDTDASHLRGRIHDDGKGFDTATAVPRAGHMGLELMQQRAGELGGDLAITSSPGAGTTICFTLPLDPVAAR